ncbi:EAL domain-containing protein [Rhodobacteraceae bacterium W635]|uniref:EAL domain-containing protein n=1 Tax=Nioella halotolerans TaxID=2303578 RepID=UPI000E3DDC50|nr:EAL domain-containing protein [Rhodobacteraceae bacterium W635]
MRGRRKRDLIEPGQESPLEFAVQSRDRNTLGMVREALGRGDCVLAYQPVVQAAAPQAVAFYEGLIRILDETGRVIPAKAFMGAVESQDLGREIDCAALRAGLRALTINPTLRLSINMSARSIGYPKWKQVLNRGLAADDRIAERLILEITESSAMQMPELVTTFMGELQERGITFALDDFGAGYTAFRYLREFYFDIVKIDGQFVRSVHADSNNQVLMEALISIARHFDMFTVAETVESGDEAAWLAQAGIDCLQGYFFGAPSLTPPWMTNPAGNAASS